MTRILLALALSALSVSAFAGELDQAPAMAPSAVLVRVDANNAQDVAVFRTEKLASGASEQALVAAIGASAVESNLITGVKNASGSELDRDSSTAAWCWWGWGNYYTYGTYSYYYTYNYSYSYYYSGYYWRWYW